RLINQAQPMQFYQLGYSASVYNNPTAGTPVNGAVIDPRLLPVAQADNRPLLVNRKPVVMPIVGDYSVIRSRQDQARAEIRYDQGDV
ncbi:hypothetical protein CVH10_22240, partial [Halomonas sp. ND22Bw]|uniref:hypothetical protein n=1 Tax=Halomonas sp. ND22Bw TaxID=2054178 RepID=UPI000D265E0C